MRAVLRLLPVHPARRGTTCLGQVSWLAGSAAGSRLPASPDRTSSDVVGAASPVTVAGAAQDLEIPPHLLPFSVRFPGQSVTSARVIGAHASWGKINTFALYVPFRDVGNSLQAQSAKPDYARWRDFPQVDGVSQAGQDCSP